MKNETIIIIALLAFFSACKNSSKESVRSDNVVTTDVTNFWKAYDQIITTQDSVLQYKYLDSLYLDKGTAGLEGIIEARKYTAEEYINAINTYPKFWNSIRQNTLQIAKVGTQLEEGIEKLKTIYPELKSAKIYFSIGAFRTPGTTIDSLVLIGSELAMADTNTNTSELPENLSYVKSYFATNPKKNLVFLNIHEYVHTQQKPRVYNLLSSVIYEGVAEFVTVKALNQPSPNPQIKFGKNNANRIREVFENEMFYVANFDKWLNGDAPNEFGMRDLGYYVGYQICENYYNQAEDKQAAIKTMIELDYENESEIEAFVQKADYFSATLDALEQNFESKRPTVVGIEQFENKSQNVNPKLKTVTIKFSEALDGYRTSVDLGPLGRDAFPNGTLNGRKWTKDNKSWTIPVDLEPNKTYQIYITNNFRTSDNRPLKPYLIEFKTENE
ncbi:gliding motility protein GldB-related protein [Winogradskyella algicola]|uniref:gliding motility protein GldB-related protein n=1 Tax=Winogradskyella algicola TaxID=2575815 RepID=UPI0011088811|nr:DUF2268 domain-containing putative Zn-dependent protease [Winogradskyella algicola]